ncbi:replication-associated recombination protein A [Mesoplasma corruscae]|uniref:Recombination factor protein RarA n=1 Tax=Mesoplasma corruscae TaxID=216874 RepID=A0A2S5RGK5_9MOLU|nr:replication-associated recombination protein A [Mesoplasma corruscae]PPE06255.1 recombination factor protein RarA [Mesoplasma corruscae]
MPTPLAYLLRPKTTKDIIGQTHLLAKDGLVERMIKNDFTSSLIFYGPSGTGKTSFAIALCNDLKIEFDTFNASFEKKEKLTSILNKALSSKRFVLIIDEIHRLNKDKQDILLSYMENGNIILYSTTTENPYFVINPALRSRANILELKRVDPFESFEYIKKLINSNKLNILLDDESLKYICEINNGDIRSLINNLEILINLYAEEKLTLDLITSIFMNAKNPSTAAGDDFHDLKSAFHKSIRGSDVDASLHYFSRLISIGDIETLMRRMVVMAYEDIGLANPSLPPRVYTACEAFRTLGMPEGIIPLGLVVIEMALSQKSNSAVNATHQAFEDVQKGMVYDIPDYLKDAHYKSAVKLNRGVGYKYPHNYKNAYVEQQYLPNKIKNMKYYIAKQDANYEKRVWEIYKTFTNKTD